MGRRPLRFGVRRAVGTRVASVKLSPWVEIPRRCVSLAFGWRARTREGMPTLEADVVPLRMLYHNEVPLEEFGRAVLREHEVMWWRGSRRPLVEAVFAECSDGLGPALYQGPN